MAPRASFAILSDSAFELTDAPAPSNDDGRGHAAVETPDADSQFGHDRARLLSRVPIGAGANRRHRLAAEKSATPPLR